MTDSKTIHWNLDDGMFNVHTRATILQQQFFIYFHLLLFNNSLILRECYENVIFNAICLNSDSKWSHRSIFSQFVYERRASMVLVKKVLWEVQSKCYESLCKNREKSSNHEETIIEDEKIVEHRSGSRMTKILGIILFRSKV